MVDVSKRSMSTHLFGCNVSMPVAISPTAFHKLAHPTGEIATAKAAGKAGIIFTLSTFSNTTIEEVANTAPNTIKWFQFFIYYDRKLTENFLRRVEAAGFNGLVLTLDANFSGKRRKDYRNEFSLPPNLKMANLDGKDLVHGTGNLSYST